MRPSSQLDKTFVAVGFESVYICTPDMSPPMHCRSHVSLAVRLRIFLSFLRARASEYARIDGHRWSLVCFVCRARLFERSAARSEAANTPESRARCLCPISISTLFPHSVRALHFHFAVDLQVFRHLPFVLLPGVQLVMCNTLSSMICHLCNGVVHVCPVLVLG